jgi:hypothetical protein
MSKLACRCWDRSYNDKMKIFQVLLPCFSFILSKQVLYKVLIVLCKVLLVLVVKMSQNIYFWMTQGVCDIVAFSVATRSM